MTLKKERLENRSVIRLEGELTVASAAELKGVLMEALSGGEDCEVDLGGAEGIDLTVMQLLWAAGREAGRLGVNIVFHAQEAASMAARDAGFEQWPK
jgi:ABC-type transporter Mla MlaB component